MSGGVQWISHAEYEAALSAFMEQPILWTADGVETFLNMYGPIAAPITLNWLATQTAGFPVHLLRPHAGRAWISARRPTLVMKWEGWNALYRAIGYTVDGELAPLPERPVRMWRGAHRNHRMNQSWTTDRGLAAAFAQGPGRGLWTALVEPSRILVTLGGNEPQSVIDTEGLTVEAQPLTGRDRAAVSFHQQRQAYYDQLAENMAPEERAQLDAYVRMFEPWEDVTP